MYVKNMTIFVFPSNFSYAILRKCMFYNLHPNTIIQKNLLTIALKASKMKIFALKVSFPLFLFIGHRRIKAVKF